MRHTPISTGAGHTHRSPHPTAAADAPSRGLGTQTEKRAETGGPVLPPVGAGSPTFRNPYTYEHVGLDDYVSRVCPDCEGVGETELLALDADRYAIVDCHACDGSGVSMPYCQCGEFVLGGAPDGDNGVCHSCELVFHRDEPDEIAAVFSPLKKPDGFERIEL